MNTSKIEMFQIKGLFGTEDVTLPFNENIKILIGENGLGKTQVLNLFYFTLTKNFYRLSEYHFSNIIINFSNGKTIDISKKSVEEYMNNVYKNIMLKDIIDDIGYTKFEGLRNNILKDNINFSNFDIFYSLSKYKNNKFLPHHIYGAIEELEKVEKKSSKLNRFKEQIDRELSSLEILYFPTFRRVEEDLYNLGYNDSELKINPENNLIQFGMGDVQKKFDEIQNKIDTLLKEGLAQFTKDILNIVIEQPTISKITPNKISESDISIILSRVGNLLPDNQKKAVTKALGNDNFDNSLIGHLLQKLIDIYEKQKELDNSVKFFRDVCNKYLIDKKVYYDESGIKIYIKSSRTEDRINLKYLSSGEKQIVSILSKIYLSEKDKKFLILFDEPELSLSIMWQKQLLPDIIDSNKCDFLLAVTHSPFIFDNKLENHAIGLNEYVKPIL